MSKKIQVTFEDWQYEKVVGRASTNEMNLSSYVRCCCLEYDWVCNKLNERCDQVEGLMELLISHGIMIPKELRG